MGEGRGRLNQRKREHESEQYAKGSTKEHAKTGESAIKRAKEAQKRPIRHKESVIEARERPIETKIHCVIECQRGAGVPDRHGVREGASGVQCSPFRLDGTFFIRGFCPGLLLILGRLRTVTGFGIEKVKTFPGNVPFQD